MRAVVQRVTSAKVTVSGECVGEIGEGLCVLVGVGKEDTATDAKALAGKVIGLRIFEDPDGKMNQALLERGGSVLAVSQFTLFGDVRKGRRPGFDAAMAPEPAKELFEAFCDECRSLGAKVQTGRFRAHMRVELTNDGPVTILVDTAKSF